MEQALTRTLLIAVVALAGTSPAWAADPGKAACMGDAKRLCAAEMNSLSRSKVRACLIAHIDQTSPTCHDFMVKARAAALSGHPIDTPGK
jgi:hypothetical protein